MKPVIGVLFLAISSYSSQTGPITDAGSQEPYPMLTTSMYSNIVGDTMMIDVSLPES